MKKEKVFIVLSHKHNLKKGSSTEWEVSETVEFINQLRPRHLSSSTAIGDYINRKMQSGSRFGMDDYNKFEVYIRTKYSKELAELDNSYRTLQVDKVTSVIQEVKDSFGNVRLPTVFDVVVNG